jgi:RimJ/RimL family protein N-acetyltransferase
MPADRVRVVRVSPGLVWRAYEADQAVGAIRAFLRPDNRWFVGFEGGRDDSYAPLLAAVAANTGADLYAVAYDNEPAHLARLAGLGFTEHRRVSSYLIPTDPAVTGLNGVTEPDDVVVISAADAYEDELRLLDDALRQDVPGTDGWRWDPGDFQEEAFDSAHFNPATYLVATDADSGRYIGLVRVRNGPGRPRLGLIGVTRPYRRRGLARALLARAFLALHQQGLAEVTAEADDAHPPSRSLLLGLGARRLGGTVEFVRHLHHAR